MSYPIKLSVKSEFVPIILLIASWILSFYFYAHFPASVPVHWNFAGEANRYGSRAEGAFAIPAILTGMYALFLALPWLDPRGERYAEFGRVYHFIKAAIIAVMSGVYAISGLASLGFPVRVNVAVPWLIGILLIILGNYMGKIKRNWFVGVRTPWTLSSENVWNKTNRFGGFMMMLFGLCVIVSPALPQALGMALFILGALLAVVGTLAYSFILYKLERKKAGDVIVR